MGRTNKEKQETRTATMVDDVRELSAPSLLRIPKKNPMWNYRWVRNQPDQISLMEAKGYQVANGEIVRDTGIKPKEDGTAKVGDLILMVEPWKHHKEHKDKEEALRDRQTEMMQRGTKGHTRSGAYGFEETIKQG
jgi:hypothetical protein